MRVLLLCDGGGSLGVGHVIRALALAEAAVAAGHEVAVAGHIEGAFLGRQLAQAGVEVVPVASPMAVGDLRPVIDVVRQVRPDLVHVDAYDAPRGLADALASDGLEPVFSNPVFSNMEDGSFGRRRADVVIDPTFGAELSGRPDDGSTWLLRGSRYTPVRERVVNARKAFGVSDDPATSVLVVMGGTDPVGLAPAAVGLLARTGLALDVTVVAVDENAQRVRAAAAGSQLSLEVLAPVDDLAEVMSRQDLVVSAAGTSVWELCCIGVPMAIVWAVDNQREGYDRVVAAGAAIGLGGPELGQVSPAGRAGDLLSAALTDPALRVDLALAGRRIVDGLGAWRVVRTWEMAVRPRAVGQPREPLPEGNAGLVTRPATLDDAQPLWEWRNDPGTRAASRHGETVPWTDHLAWLRSSLARTDRLLFVVDDGDGPVGTVRWDLEHNNLEHNILEQDVEGEWEVSVTVAPDRRGQSLARPLLRAGELALSGVARSSASRVTAYLAVVHVDNLASVRLFETSGYLPDLPPDEQGFMRFRKVAPVT